MENFENLNFVSINSCDNDCFAITSKNLVENNFGNHEQLTVKNHGSPQNDIVSPLVEDLETNSSSNLVYSPFAHLTSDLVTPDRGMLILSTYIHDSQDHSIDVSPKSQSNFNDKVHENSPITSRRVRNRIPPA